ncbi:lasso peptide biosynthesis B2 protein [Halomonas sp. LN1S58]|uniref:Lasso peptide biosynthesis B2 protein n=2 Tax=Halomonas kalidii TaxID=3043293 RepID=A0ABT6VJM3_9GAMM|nr:lasso peptide biosynthesis B2 protein [Halomonas kalidii]
MLAEAAMQLLLAWLVVRVVPFRWWSHWLGDSISGEADPQDAIDDQRARDISWAVTAINRAVGGRYTCLMLAVAAQRMLDRRHISSSLVLGTFTEYGEDRCPIMTAHAWLRVGRQVVLGHHDGRYAAVASFVRSYRHLGNE